MKTLFSIVLLGSVHLLSAQDAAIGVANELFEPRRVIKTNLVGYVWGSINLNYEQKVGAKTSIGLMGGYKLPSVITVNAIGELDGESQTYTGEIEPSGPFVNPYFRYYTNQSLKGFYIELFARYYHYTFLVPYDYDKNGQTIRANLDGRANGIGGGLALGVQLPISPRVYLDLHAGYGMGVGNIHVETNDPNLELEDYLSIKRNIERYQDDADLQIFLLGDILTDPVVVATESGAWADFNNKLFPMVRAGVSIGFAF